MTDAELHKIWELLSMELDSASGDQREARAAVDALIAEVRRLREALGTADSILQGESAADILVITDGNLAAAPTLGAVIRSALNPS